MTSISILNQSLCKSHYNVACKYNIIFSKDLPIQPEFNFTFQLILRSIDLDTCPPPLPPPSDLSIFSLLKWWLGIIMFILLLLLPASAVNLRYIIIGRSNYLQPADHLIEPGSSQLCANQFYSEWHQKIWLFSMWRHLTFW